MESWSSAEMPSAKAPLVVLVVVAMISSDLELQTGNGSESGNEVDHAVSLSLSLWGSNLMRVTLATGKWRRSRAASPALPPLRSLAAAAAGSATRW